MVTLGLTVGGSLADFDSARFKSNLAATLPGAAVAPEDIDLELSEGSVVVLATIAVPSFTQGQVVASYLQAQSAPALSSALQMDVLTIDAPAALHTNAPPPSAPPPWPPRVPLGASNSALAVNEGGSLLGPLSLE